MARIASKQDPLRILLVEDSKGDAMLLEKALHASMLASYTLKRASTLGEALKTLSEHEFDVALLDRSLPDAEGFGGLHSIQNIAPQLPVVLLTAYKDEETAFKAIEQGAQDYLYKDDLNGHIIRRAVQYAILRKQFEGVLILRANFDMLTGLANRMLFEGRLDMALAKTKRHGGNVAVLFLDLDRFKQVNDTLGHAAGDQLLKEVGKRLKSVLRPYDTAARFGGDEFAVLLEGLTGISHAETVARKIIDLMTAPFNAMGKKVEIGVSIGIACCGVGSGSAALLQQADAAMYVAKSASGNCYHVDATHSPMADMLGKRA